jgi:hypothetical protein
VPVTLTLKLPNTAEPSVSVDTVVPPAVRVTVAGFSEAESPAKDDDAIRLTVPEKPLVLAILIDAVFEEPIVNGMVVAFVVTPKLGMKFVTPKFMA